jgi:hypothetical protein
MKCKKCGADKLNLRCENCNTISIDKLAVVWSLGIVPLMFVGAFLYAHYQATHPQAMPRVESALVDKHKDQIEEFFRVMKTKKKTVSSFEYLGWQSYQRGPLKCGDYQDGHTDNCRVFFVDGQANPKLAKVHCPEVLAFAKELGATNEFTNELNQATSISESSLAHCILNYKTGYLLTGTSSNKVPFAVYLYQNEANFPELVVSPRYENMKVKLLN